MNTFYLQKEVEFKLRLETLNKKKQKAKERNTLENIKEAFLQFQLDLAKLQKFVQLNATGFRKILKKWDKRAKSSTKEVLYTNIGKNNITRFIFLGRSKCNLASILKC